MEKIKKIKIQKEVKGHGKNHLEESCRKWKGRYLQEPQRKWKDKFGGGWVLLPRVTQTSAGDFTRRRENR